MNSPVFTTSAAMRAAFAEAITCSPDELQEAIGQVVVAEATAMPLSARIGKGSRSLYDPESRITALLADLIPAGQEAIAIAQEIERHHGRQAAQAVLGERASELLGGDGKMSKLKNGDIVTAQRAYVAIAKTGDCGVVVEAPQGMLCHPGTLVLVTPTGYIAIDAEDVIPTGRELEGASFETCNSARLRGTLGQALTEGKLSNYREGALVVDGLDETACFAGDGERAPFVVFDVDRQTNIAGPFASRDLASQHRLEILSGHPPRLDSTALSQALTAAENGNLEDRNTTRMSPAWSDEHRKAANHEGWDIWDTSGSECGPWQIQRFDEAHENPGVQLDSDDDALRIVGSGSAPHHEAARRFIKAHSTQEWEALERTIQKMGKVEDRDANRMRQSWNDAAANLGLALEKLIPHVLHYASMPNAHSDADRLRCCNNGGGKSRPSLRRETTLRRVPACNGHDHRSHLWWLFHGRCRFQVSCPGPRSCRLGAPLL